MMTFAKLREDWKATTSIPVTSRSLIKPNAKRDLKTAQERLERGLKRSGDDDNDEDVRNGKIQVRNARLLLQAIRNVQERRQR